MAVSAQSVNDHASSANPSGPSRPIGLRPHSGIHRPARRRPRDRRQPRLRGRTADDRLAPPRPPPDRVRRPRRGRGRDRPTAPTCCRRTRPRGSRPGARHQATLHASVTTISVLFEPSLVPAAGDQVRILAASPLIREMVMHAVRWPITRRDDDPVADDFFRTLGHLVGDELGHESRRGPAHVRRPGRGRGDRLHATHTWRRSRSARSCAAIGVSERTLRRRFADSLDMSWRSYLVQARILRSMALLTEPGTLGARRVARGRLRERERVRPGVHPPRRRGAVGLPSPRCDNSIGTSR